MCDPARRCVTRGVACIIVIASDSDSYPTFPTAMHAPAGRQLFLLQLRLVVALVSTGHSAGGAQLPPSAGAPSSGPVNCNPKAHPAQLCPGARLCPQCGKPACLCPALGPPHPPPPPAPPPPAPHPPAPPTPPAPNPPVPPAPPPPTPPTPIPPPTPTPTPPGPSPGKGGQMQWHEIGDSSATCLARNGTEPAGVYVYTDSPTVGNLAWQSRQRQRDNCALLSWVVTLRSVANPIAKF